MNDIWTAVNVLKAVIISIVIFMLITTYPALQSIWVVLMVLVVLLWVVTIVEEVIKS